MIWRYIYMFYMDLTFFVILIKNFIRRKFKNVLDKWKHFGIIFALTLSVAGILVFFKGVKHIMVDMFLYIIFLIETHKSIIGVVLIIAVIVQFSIIALLIKRVLKNIYLWSYYLVNCLAFH